MEEAIDPLIRAVCHASDRVNGEESFGCWTGRWGLDHDEWGLLSPVAVLYNCIEVPWNLTGVHCSLKLL